MPALNYLNWLQRAKKSGKGMGAMLREIASLQFSKGKISPEEYFLYELYDDQRYTPEAKHTFIGSNGPSVESPWASVVHDKPTLTAILRGLEFPIPETQAIVHPTRTFGGAEALRTADDLRRFLRDGANYPIFGKPYDSACSLGTANIAEFDHGGDSLVMSDGRRVPLDEFVGQVEKLGWKYLLQTRMQTHESLVPIVGQRVCTVRMFVLSDYEGCHLLRASWKIPAFENGADNFWRRGNILAGIDVETGKVIRSLRRTADGTERIDQHPLTGHSLKDLVFPQWDAMRDVVLRAAPNLPECYFQGWDVALTDRGPVLVELEGDGGDPIMEQLCFDSGLMQGRFETFIEQHKAKSKEKKETSKAQRLAKLKRNLTALSAGAEDPSSNGSKPTSPEAKTEATPQADQQAEAAPTPAPVVGNDGGQVGETVAS